MSRPRRSARNQPLGTGRMACSAEPVLTARRLKARGPADLLALIPFLLGYHPSESLVLVLLAGRRVSMCARLDLAAGRDPGSEQPSRAEQDDLIAAIHHLLSARGASAVILVAYGADRPGCCALLDRVVAELGGDGGCIVVEALYADGARWWSRSCSASCCPNEGTSYAVADSPLAAEAVYAGLAAVGGRQEIAAAVAGPPAQELARLEERCRALVEEKASDRAPGPRSDRRTGVESRQELMRRLVPIALGVLNRSASGAVNLVDGELVNGELVDGELVDGELVDDDVAEDQLEELCLRLAMLADDVQVRDVAWSLISCDQADQHVELWSRVVACAVPRLATGPLGLLGAAAWVAGNGTLQMCCVERIRALDPRYSMAELLADINRQALPPQLWEQIAPAIRVDLARSGRLGGEQMLERTGERAEGRAAGTDAGRTVANAGERRHH